MTGQVDFSSAICHHCLIPRPNPQITNDWEVSASSLSEVLSLFPSACVVLYELKICMDVLPTHSLITTDALLGGRVMLAWTLLCLDGENHCTLVPACLLQASNRDSVTIFCGCSSCSFCSEIDGEHIIALFITFLSAHTDFLTAWYV